MLTWVIHCINHDSPIPSIPPMLMHQRSDLSRFRFPSYAAVALVISVVPLIARLAMRMASTRYMLDSPHILSIG